MAKLRCSEVLTMTVLKPRAIHAGVNAEGAVMTSRTSFDVYFSVVSEKKGSNDADFIVETAQKCQPNPDAFGES